MLKSWEKLNFMNVLEGDILEDEVASNRFGYYSLLWFGGIILISSSISLSHYIKRDLSWKNLRLNRLIFVWRFPTSSWELCFSYTSYMVDLLHSKVLEQVCVLEQRAIERWPYKIKVLVVFSTFYLIWYNYMFLSLKDSLVFLYDS